MKAAYYERNGTARDVLRVGEIETPPVGAGEVRVKLAASGVNPSDVKSRLGATRKIAWPRVIPHSDGAGVIEDVGDGVPRARVGERVWVWNGQWKRAFGTAADTIVLPAAQAVPLPERVSFEEGACLGIPAMTACHAVALAGPAHGGTLLISGGAGAVSQYAIQFAKAQGATVITTVSSADKATAAREAGADHTIDYARLLPGVLRPKGSVVVYGTGPEATIPAFFCLTSSIRLQFFLVYELDAAERARAVGAIGRALSNGTLHNRVAQPTFTLDDIAAAHEAVERGTIGNVVLKI
jgi:NADPH2:quinone reductase